MKIHNRKGSFSIGWLTGYGLTAKHKRYLFSPNNYDPKNNLWLKSVSYAVIGKLHICFQRFMTIRVSDDLATFITGVRQ